MSWTDAKSVDELPKPGGKPFDVITHQGCHVIRVTYSPGRPKPEAILPQTEKGS